MVTRVFAYNGRVLSEEGPNLNAGQVVVRAWERDTRPTSSAPIVGTPPNGYFLLRLGLTLGEPSPARLAASTLTPAVLAYAPASVRATLKTASDQRMIRESRVILPRSRVDVRDLGDDAARLVLPGSAADSNDGVGADAVVAVGANELVRPALAGSPIVVDVPPLQLLADEPDPGGAFDGGGVVGPATQSLPDTFFDEVRFANAIWTHVADDVANFAVGRSSIWVTRTDGVLQQLALHPLGSGDGLPTYDRLIPPITLAVSSDPNDPTPRGDVAWALLVTGALFFHYDGGSEWVEGLGFIRDVAAAAGPPPSFDGVSNVSVLTGAGELARVVQLAGADYLMPSAATRGKAFDRVSVEKRSAGILAIGDGQLYRVASGLAAPVYAPSNLTAAARVGDDGLFVLQRDEGTREDETKRIYRFSSDRQTWLQQQGRAREIETGYDGTLWLTDGEQRLFARGLRVLGATVNARELPVGAATNPTADMFPPFFAELLTSFLQLDAGLYPDLVREAYMRLRSVGAGGQAALASYAEYFAAPTNDPADALQRQRVRALAESWFSTASGAESIAVLAPAFTADLQLPEDSTYESLGVPELFLNAGFQSQYVADVDEYLNNVGTERIRYISIGNEIDLFANAQAPPASDVLSAYAEFARQVIPSLSERHPTVKFSLSCTLVGAAQMPNACAELFEAAEVILLTYYAVELATFTALPPSAYQAEFPGKIDVLLDAFRSRYPGRSVPKVAMQEIAIPSSSIVGGSEEEQRDFVRYVLQQWAARGGDWDFLSWFPLADYWYDPNLQVVPTQEEPGFAVVRDAGDPFPADVAPGVPYIGNGNMLAGFFGATGSIVDKIRASTTDPFRRACAFLSSCGLFRADGTPKPAAVEYASQARAIRMAQTT